MDAPLRSVLVRGSALGASVVDGAHDLDTRLVRAFLVLATLAAAALRLPFLNHQGFWFDELFTRAVAAEPSVSALWTHVRATESTPPLYYLIVWLLGGRSAASLRLVPALALIAAVPVSYFAFRRVIGKRAALATAAVLAISPELVEYSSDARVYGVFVLIALLSAWGFVSIIEQPSWRRYVAWAIPSAVCLWTHYFGFFLVAGEVTALLIVRAELWRKTLAYGALIAVCALPLVPLVVAQNDNRAEFLTQTSLVNRLTATIREFAMGANVPRSWLEACGLASVLAASVAGMVIALRSGRQQRALLLVAAAGFFLPLALAALRVEDRFYARNMLFLLPILAALTAPAFTRLRCIPLTAYLALALVTSLWVSTAWRYQQADWRSAINRLHELDRAAPIVVVPQPRTDELVAQFYLQADPSTSVISARRAWLVVEPYRGAHHRGLGPAPIPGAIRGDLALFNFARAVTVHGFRLILLTAPRARTIDPRTLIGATLFALPR